MKTKSITKRHVTDSKRRVLQFAIIGLIVMLLVVLIFWFATASLRKCEVSSDTSAQKCADAYVGLTERQARDRAKIDGFSTEFIRDDDNIHVKLPVLVTNEIELTLENGIVTRAYIADWHNSPLITP